MHSDQLMLATVLASVYHFHAVHGVQADAAADAVKDVQARAASYQKDVGRLRGNMAAASTAVEAARSARASLLETATMEQVGLAVYRLTHCSATVSHYVSIAPVTPVI